MTKEWLHGLSSSRAPQLFDLMGTVDSSVTFDQLVSREGFSRRSLSRTFRSKPGQQLASFLLADREKNAFQLGVYFSFVSLGNLNPDLKAKVSSESHPSSPFKLRANEKLNWTLCSDAEPRLIEAIRDQAILPIVVEGKTVMLLKFVGRLAGLCVGDFCTEDGKLFVAGNWYEPIGKKARQNLRDVFDEGLLAYVPEESMVWTLIRPLGLQHRSRRSKKLSAEKLLHDTEVSFGERRRNGLKNKKSEARMSYRHSKQELARDEDYSSG